MQRYLKLNDAIVMEWTPDQISEYLVSKGVTDSEVREVRGMSTKGGQLLATGELFAAKNFKNFSGTDLAFVLFGDRWGDREDNRKLLARVYSGLSHLYREYKPIKEETKITYTHLLRIESGCNQSNLHRLWGYEISKNKLIKTPTQRTYPGVSTSPGDWRDGITLPLPGEITTGHARFFGYLWAAGTVYRPRGGGLTVNIRGKEKVRTTLEETVRPLAQEIFNVPFFDDSPTPGTTDFGEGEREVAGVSFERGSKAIGSYLLSEHGFIDTGAYDRIAVPNLAWSEEFTDEFVRGVIAINGVDLTSEPDRNWRTIYIHGKGHQGGEELSKLLRQAGHGHSFQKNPGGYKTKKYWTVTLQKAPSIHFADSIVH